MEIKRFIDIHVPVYNCNFKCQYCYVGQKEQPKRSTKFFYSPEVTKKALTKERLGGICHFNVCGLGETMLPKELSAHIKGILENGHTVIIVTNGSLLERFQEYMAFPEDLKKRLGFKFSYHYLELLRLGKMEDFWNNVRLVKQNGCTFSVELTANDGYEECIDEIKESCIKNIGALCHLSVPRNEGTRSCELMSRHTKEEFYRIWKTFESPMFEFKIRHWEEKRREICYAGLWSGILNLSTGEFTACYNQPPSGINFFEDLQKPLKFEPVCKCEMAHCFNGHSFLTFGVIPEIEEESYLDIRDRVDAEGNHWVNETMASQFSHRLKESNSILSQAEIKYYLKRHTEKKVKFNLHKLEKKLHIIKKK